MVAVETSTAALHDRHSLIIVIVVVPAVLLYINL